MSGGNCFSPPKPTRHLGGNRTVCVPDADGGREPENQILNVLEIPMLLLPVLQGSGRPGREGWGRVGHLLEFLGEGSRNP
jgi:hypothetical protein